MGTKICPKCGCPHGEPTNLCGPCDDEVSSGSDDGEWEYPELADD